MWKLYSVEDAEFKAYGNVVKGYDTAELVAELKKFDIPSVGDVYYPSVEKLESLSVYNEYKNREFGGVDIQIGFCGGMSDVLNCLEYHRNSEFLTFATDAILVIGMQQEMEDGKFDTSKAKCFYVKEGTSIELFATTLHWTPFHVKKEDGVRFAVTLVRGTNEAMPKIVVGNAEDKMLLGANKWVLAHPDSQDAKDGAYVGLTGKNITFDDIER